MHTLNMPIEVWWPKLRPEIREWLVINNGDAVPATIRGEIEAVGGPGPADGWWVEQEGSDDPSMPDDAVDWIEEVANAETPAD